MKEQDLETTQEVETTSDLANVAQEVKDVQLSSAFIKDKYKKFYICNIKTGVVECVLKIHLIESNINVGGYPENELQYTYKDIFDRYSKGDKVVFSRDVEQPDGSMKAFPCNYTVPSPKTSPKQYRQEPRLKGVSKHTQVVNKVLIKDEIYTTKSGHIKHRKTYEGVKPKTILHDKNKL